MAILQISPTSSPKTLSTGQKKDFECVHFSVTVLEYFCPQPLVCTQSADFIRKDLSYCFSALFVIMYISCQMSYIFLGLAMRSVLVQVFNCSSFFFLLKEHGLLLGYNYGDFFTVYHARRYVLCRYSEYFLNIGCEMCSVVSQLSLCALLWSLNTKGSSVSCVLIRMFFL